MSRYRMQCAQIAYDNREPPDYSFEPEVTDEHRHLARLALLKEYSEDDILPHQIEELAAELALEGV